MTQNTAVERGRRPGFRAMLIGLGVDNFGSGMFLPLTLVYLNRVAGLPLGTAGAVLAAGTVAGTLAPAVVARFLDRWGAKAVVAVSQLLQAAGMVAYLAARDVPLALAGAAMTAAGVQVFYAALGTMTAESTRGGDHDRAFATVNMVRTAAFGLGGLTGGVLLNVSGDLGLTACLLLNAASFVTAAVVLTAALPSVHKRVVAERERMSSDVWAPLRDRAFLLLAAVAFLLFLSLDLFLTVMPPYVDVSLGAPGWAVGAAVAVSTGLGAIAGTWAIACTERMSRAGNLRLAAAIQVAWGIVMAALVIVPGELRPAALIAATVLLSAGNLIGGPRVFSYLAEIAPAEHKGSYFSLFQYAFTAAQFIAPIFAGLLPLAPWAPWAVNAALLVLAFPAIRALTAASSGTPG